MARILRRRQWQEDARHRRKVDDHVQQATHKQLTKHRDKWNKAVLTFTKVSIEDRQAMIMGKIEELQHKKKRLESLLERRHSRSTQSLDLDARIRASASAA